MVQLFDKVYKLSTEAGLVPDDGEQREEIYVDTQHGLEDKDDDDVASVESQGSFVLKSLSSIRNLFSFSRE